MNVFLNRRPAVSSVLRRPCRHICCWQFFHPPSLVRGGRMGAAAGNKTFDSCQRERHKHCRVRMRPRLVWKAQSRCIPEKRHKAEDVMASRSSSPRYSSRQDLVLRRCFGGRRGSIACERQQASTGIISWTSKALLRPQLPLAGSLASEVLPTWTSDVCLLCGWTAVLLPSHRIGYAFGCLRVACCACRFGAQLASSRKQE